MELSLSLTTSLEDFNASVKQTFREQMAVAARLSRTEALRILLTAARAAARFWLLGGGGVVVDVTTHVTQDRTRHPGFPAVQLRLTYDQICTGSESLHVKYGATIALCAIIGKQPALDFRHNLCIVAHTISKS